MSLGRISRHLDDLIPVLIAVVIIMVTLAFFIGNVVLWGEVLRRLF